MISASAAYCPNCAALLSFEPGQTHVSCSYCEATLMLDTGRVTHQRRGISPPRPATEDDTEPIAQPDPTLFVRDAPRFRTRIIEQLAGLGGGQDLFRTIELDDDCFAIISMRAVDAVGDTADLPLEPAFEVLSESLSDDGDPGLAANLALEELARSPQFHQLECAICVLDPRRTTAQVYCAGARNAVWWVSTEEGRPIIAGTSHQALERADLAKSGSHFDNASPRHLAAQDVLVVASFGYYGDEAVGSGAVRAMTEVFREHLGEDPQRLVTLVKNAFWEAREKGHKAGLPLSGDIRIAAVGARLAEVSESASLEPRIELVETPHFRVALQRRGAEPAVDAVRSWTLDEGRSALLFLERDGPLTEAEIEAARTGVHGILARKSSGDFDNPRAAGRNALATLQASAGVDPDSVRILVMHLSDEYRRVKYYARGWKAGLALGARGLKPDFEQQQFDEGGEVTCKDGARLFFPGALEYEGNVLKAAGLSERWYGGKSSHLYEALRLHWRTKKSEKALLKIVRAAATDVGASRVSGLVLVTAV